MKTTYFPNLAQLSCKRPEGHVSSLDKLIQRIYEELVYSGHFLKALTSNKRLPYKW